MRSTAAVTVTSIALFTAHEAQCADIRVPQDQPTIQAAVDAASDGDRVAVAPGTYAPFTFRGKHITVESTNGAEATTINATGMPTSAVVFEPGAGFDTVLRGFTVRTGAGIQEGPSARVGGGCALRGDPQSGVPSCGTIEDCVFIGATGGCWQGGGIWAWHGNVAVRRCDFSSTGAIHFGGAMVVQPVAGVLVPGSGGYESVVQDCAVAGTSSYNNGGFHFLTSNESQQVIRMRVSGTDFVGNSAPYAAGALLLWSPFVGASPLRVELESCRFSGNRAGLGNSVSCGIGEGGGSFVELLAIENCLFEDPPLSIRCGDATSVRIGNSVFCAGTSAIGSTYVNGGGNSFTCDLSADCDNDGVPDLVSTTLGRVADANHDRVPDSCQCVGDLNLDRQVNGSDLSGLLAFWGPNPAYGPADLNADGRVNGADLALLLSLWGPCAP